MNRNEELPNNTQYMRFLRTLEFLGTHLNLRKRNSKTNDNKIKKKLKK